MNKKNNNKSKHAIKSDLKSFLQSVYHDTVSLETTCNHRCECCNVAMPACNYCEFVQIITELWGKLDKKEKVFLLCKSLEYFFKNDYKKWGMSIFIKPCLLLDKKTNLCRIYESRPISCRLYGLWPENDYNQRVDKFEKAYAPLGIKREDLPLHKQCPYVKRKDDSIPLTTEVINSLFKKLDEMDVKIGEFSKLQVSQKENYRTFHDWILLKVLGEEWLTKLTTFALEASREAMENQIKAIQDVWNQSFGEAGLPDITEVL
jgi:Fe-S-cluster containining protein